MTQTFARASVAALQEQPSCNDYFDHPLLSPYGRFLPHQYPLSHITIDRSTVPPSSLNFFKRNWSWLTAAAAAPTSGSMANSSQDPWSPVEWVMRADMRLMLGDGGGRLVLAGILFPYGPIRRAMVGRTWGDWSSWFFVDSNSSGDDDILSLEADSVESVAVVSD